MEGAGSSNRDMTVVCGDLDQTMVDLVEQRIKENGWQVKAELLDAQVLSTSMIATSGQREVLTLNIFQDIPYGNNYFTHVLMNFGPQLMPDPIKALRGKFNCEHAMLICLRNVVSRNTPCTAQRRLYRIHQLD